VSRGFVCVLLVVGRLRGHGRVVGCHDACDGGAVAASGWYWKRRERSQFVVLVRRRRTRV
jgi:hypothetical protein